MEVYICGVEVRGSVSRLSSTTPQSLRPAWDAWDSVLNTLFSLKCCFNLKKWLSISKQIIHTMYRNLQRSSLPKVWTLTLKNKRKWSEDKGPVVAGTLCPHFSVCSGQVRGRAWNSTPSPEVDLTTVTGGVLQLRHRIERWPSRIPLFLQQLPTSSLHSHTEPNDRGLITVCEQLTESGGQVHQAACQDLCDPSWAF